MTAHIDGRIGSTIAGFEVEEPVGEGGMGAVYLARDPTLKRRVALKVVAPALAGDPRYRSRFLREAELAASLDHPAIVPVYAAGESDGDLYLAMRYVEGGSLADRLLAEGRLDPGRATALLAPVAAALDAAHAAGLAHRDVKPGNILLDGDHPYLADFGLARPTTATATAPATAAGLLGTVGYLAPEQLEGQPASPRADQYALACVLFECLTGRRPFERENDIAVVYAHHTEAPPGVTSLEPGLPREIDAVVARGLAKRPADRYGSCRELIEAAARACGVRVDAHRRPPAPPRQHARRRHRRCLARGRRGAGGAARARPAQRRRGGGSGAARPRRRDRRRDRRRRRPHRSGLGSVAHRDRRGGGVGAERRRPHRHAGRPRDAGAGPAVRGGRRPGRPRRRRHAARSSRGRAGRLGDDEHGRGGDRPLADAVVPIDPSTLAALGRVELDAPAASGAVSAGGGMVSAANALWVVQPDGSVARDPRTRPRGHGVLRDVQAHAITATDDAVWAVGDRLWRIDPVSGEVTDVLDLGDAGGPHAIAAGGGAVWVSTWTDGTIWRVDSAAPEQRDTIPGPSHATSLTYVGGRLWTLVRGDGAALSMLDPATGRVLRTVGVAGSAHGVATDGRRLFVTTSAPGAQASEADAGPEDVDSPACTPAEHGPGDASPQFLIVSDLPLAGASAADGRSMADAVRSVLAARGWRAGGYSVGHQSCSNTTERGTTAELRCARNAARYAATPRVLGVVGTGDPFCTLAEVQALATAPGGPVPVISPGAGDSLDAMDRVGTGNLARLTAPESRVVGALLSFAADDLGARRLLVVAPEPWRFAALGAVPAARLGLTLRTSDWPDDPATLADRATQAAPTRSSIEGFATQPASALRRSAAASAPTCPSSRWTPCPCPTSSPGPGATSRTACTCCRPRPPSTTSRARGQAWVRTFARVAAGRRGPRAPVAAQAAEVLLDAIARSDGTRASVTRELARTRVSDGLLRPFRLDQHGNAAPSPVIVLRVKGAAQASGDLQPAFTGAAVVERITAPGLTTGSPTARRTRRSR